LDLLHPPTDEELRRLSAQNPGYRFERTADGKLVVSPTGGESGRRSAELLLQLGTWNRRTGLGVVFDASTGFLLPDGSCRSPDAAWVPRARWLALSPEERRAFPPLCPDAVFEIRSESDGLSALRTKLEAYLANGARLAVLVDPDRRVVEVFRAGHAPEAHAGVERVALGPELPGFVLEVGPIFAE
jgi:Uma2 family endonuclease